MAHDIRLVPATDFLRLNLRGLPDVATSEQMLAEMASAYADDPRRHVVIDCRGIPDPTSVPRLSSIELAELARGLWTAGLGVSNRVAIIRHPHAGFDRAGFFADVADGRGLTVAVFDDFESAFVWLFGEGHPVSPTDPPIP